MNERAWPLRVFLTTTGVGLALLLGCGLASIPGWAPAAGVAAVVVGLTGCWCLVLVHLLTRPRGPLLLELPLTAAGAGPPWLFSGLLLTAATSASGELVPEVALSPALAWVLTPVLVGWLVVLAWRLLCFVPEPRGS